MKNASTAPRSLRLLRQARLGLHLLSGALTVAAVYPFLAPPGRLRLKQRWSRQLLKILGIRLDTRLCSAAPGSLFVANHISWLDIFVLNAMRPMAFVSKSEVRHWPLAGWLAENTDTLFLQRGRHCHAIAVNEQIGAMLAAGKDVAVFPEGTTTDGSRLLDFYGALLQPAIDTGSTVQPLALGYFDETGRRSLAPAYAGETTMRESLAAILSCRTLTARLRPTPAIAAENLQRREVAATARNAIASHLDTISAYSSGRIDLEDGGGDESGLEASFPDATATT